MEHTVGHFHVRLRNDSVSVDYVVILIVLLAGEAAVLQVGDGERTTIVGEVGNLERIVRTVVNDTVQRNEFLLLQREVSQSSVFLARQLLEVKFDGFI